jgi:hypothetical protein
MPAGGDFADVATGSIVNWVFTSCVLRVDLHDKSAEIQALANTRNHTSDNEHADVNGSSLNCCAECKDERADADTARSSQAVCKFPSEERGDCGRNEDGRNDQAMDCWRGVSYVFCEVLHHRHGSDDSCVVAEKVAAERAEDAGDDIAGGLFEFVEGEHLGADWLQVCCSNGIEAMRFRKMSDVPSVEIVGYMDAEVTNLSANLSRR